MQSDPRIGEKDVFTDNLSHHHQRTTEPPGPPQHGIRGRGCIQPRFPHHLSADAALVPEQLAEELARERDRKALVSGKEGKNVRPDLGWDVLIRLRVRESGGKSENPV